jgi:hypothetical protein
VRIPLVAAAIVLYSIGAQPVLSQVLVAPNPYSQLFAQTVRQNQDAWRQLGAEVTDVVSPKLTAVEVTMSCGRYTEQGDSERRGNSGEARPTVRSEYRHRQHRRRALHGMRRAGAAPRPPPSAPPACGPGEFFSVRAANHAVQRPTVL